MFWRQNTKLNNSFKIKLDRKRLFPTSSVKYLGVLLDEHLIWSPQISHVQMKLNRAIGILSKLRYQANIHVLKTVDHSLFGTIFFMPASYGVKITKKHKINFDWTLQNRALKKIKIAFKNQYENADPLYKNLTIIKFQTFSDYTTACLCVNLNKIEN